MTKKEGNFVLKTVMWVVLMIVGLAGMLLSILYYTVNGFPALSAMLLGLIISGLIFFESLQQLINGEQQWKRDIIDEILDKDDMRWASWKFPSKHWDGFIEKDISYRSQLPRIATAVVLGFSTLGLCIAFFGDGRDYRVLAIGIPVIALLSFVVWQVTQANLMQMKKAYRKGKETGEVVLSPTGIIINHSYLIPLSYFGGTLYRVGLSKRYGYQTMKFVMRVSAGNTTAFHNYYVPIPEGQYAEAAVVKLRFTNHYHLPH